MLVDESNNYREVIKGRELLEEIVRSGQHRPVNMLTVPVDSSTDDVERMIAAVEVMAEKNPTGQPPYCLPTEDHES